ncbi:MAG: G5 domain-containing protein [Burkholderiales bacterium]|nr:G5 domain-containing protein [Anaerolineae bacterium]
MLKRILLIIFTCFAFTACQPEQPETSILVALVVDGRELTFEYTVPVTVGEFLRDAEIELGDQDDVNPPVFTQIGDGMRVTVVRVAEQVNCEQNEIPYRRRTIPNEVLSPGEEQLGQSGQNGVEEVCSRVQIRDGAAGEAVEISRTIITAPQEEVVYVGPTGELDPVPVTGTLAYISNRNAWVMRGSSTTKRPLTTTSDLDARVFNLSENGQKLLFTRETAASERDTFFNQLWLITNTAEDREPLQLIPADILYADWVPAQDNVISYSTGEARDAAPGWNALNDLWLMRLDPISGEALDVQQLVEPSAGGLYGWWGTQYEWSPNGTMLAWIRADSIGLVNMETGEFDPLLNYPVFRTFGDWSWRATLSWSPDNSLIATTVHGAPVGSEPPETSPAFNIAITDTTGSFQADIVDGAGIWAAPQYSPPASATSEFPVGYLAYLRAREPYNSINGEYDLVAADRDGSNSRTIFPEEGQPGIQAQEFVWSPDGQQIAFIYQGNLWIIDVGSEVAHQLTLDGGASRPVWTQ